MSRRAVALALAAAIVLAGCGSTVQQRNGTPLANGGGFSPAGGDELGGAGNATADGAHGSSSASSGAGAGAAAIGRNSSSGAVASGGSKSTAGPKQTSGPLEVGFLNTKTGNASAFGLNTGETYPPRQVFEALVKAINAKGGIAGRQLVPVISDTDTASASWDTDFAAACQNFTQDHHVAVVLGYAFGLFASLEGCLAKAGVPHLDGGYAVGDITTFQQYPLFVGTSHLTDDRRYVLQLKGAVDHGLLTKANKVGLLLDDCAEEVRAHKRSTQPYIQSAGINVVATATMSCTAGATDIGPVANQIQGAVLSFRSKGVDTVVAEGVPVVVFSTSAESQGWHPRYLLTSTTGGAAIEPNIPADQAQNMYGFGWFPPADVDAANQPPPTPGQQRCLALLQSQGLAPSQYNDFVSSYTSCDALFLYEAGLTATHGNASGPAVIAAIAALGTGYGSVSTLNGRTGFSTSRRDAPAEYRPWAWVSSCSCFRYSGPAAPIP